MALDATNLFKAANAGANGIVVATCTTSGVTTINGT